MLNLKVSKQTRSEASKNKVIIKRVSNKRPPVLGLFWLMSINIHSVRNKFDN